MRADRRWASFAPALLLAASACTAGHTAVPRPFRTSASAGTIPGIPSLDAPVRNAPAGSIARLAAWRLPEARSREVVLELDGKLLVLGGRLPSGKSTPTTFEVDPATGRAARGVPLAVATHDAGGAVLNGAAYVFGGGSATAIDAVQRFAPGGAVTVVGHLPQPRTDLSVVTQNGVAYIVGGFDGTTYLPTVLATTDGPHFRSAGSLTVPVRYAAVVATPGAIWVIGGVLPRGESDAIQRLDLSTGRCTIVGRLSASLSHASAIVSGNRILVLGGRHGDRRTRTILAIEIADRVVTSVGSLPYAVGDGAVLIAGGRALLVGGETPKVLATVIALDGVV